MRFDRWRRPHPVRRDTRLELCPLEPRDVPSAIGALVPAYFYPSAASSPWDQLTADAGQVPIMAIMNPASGPGPGVNSDYVAAVGKLQAAGGQVIGYVHTSYATRPLDQVLTEINEYESWYGVDGFFIDEMTSDADAAHLSYYQQIDDYVQGLGPNFTVVGNPGTNTVEDYLSRPVADVLVTFENRTGYETYTPPDWAASYPAQQFANLVYNVPSADTMRNDVNLAAGRNVGWLYVTDGDLPNPWDHLPPYWEDFVATLAATGPGAAPGTAGGGGPAVTPGKDGAFTEGTAIADLRWAWAAGGAPALGFGAPASSDHGQPQSWGHTPDRPAVEPPGWAVPVALQGVTAPLSG